MSNYLFKFFHRLTWDFVNAEKKVLIKHLYLKHRLPISISIGDLISCAFSTLMHCCFVFCFFLFQNEQNENIINENEGNENITNLNKHT